MRELNRKVGDMEFDGLITDLNPPVEVRGGTISRLATAEKYERGTILAMNTDDDKLYILGTSATGTFYPHSILCDDTDIGTAEDSSQAVYTAGCFHPEKVTVASGYTITAEDLDELRKRNIVFRLPHEAL
jgi:hypothetical protein